MSLSKQRRNITNFPNSVFGPLNTVSPIIKTPTISSVEKTTPLLAQYIVTEDGIIISTEYDERIITE